MRAMFAKPLVVAAGVGLLMVLAKPAAADGPAVLKIDLASGNRSIWGIGGNLRIDNYAPGTTAVGDLDGDGVADVGTVATAGGSSNVWSRTGWDGTVQGNGATAPNRLSDAAYAYFGDTYTDSTGRVRKSGVINVGDFNLTDRKISSFSWGVSNPTNVGTAGMSKGRTVAPYGPTYQGDIHIAAGDVDGDGIDELITAAQSQTPSINGAVSHQISIFKPTATTFTPLVSFDAVSSGNVGSMSIAAGKFDDPKNSWILTSFNDPSTGSPLLKLFSITAEVQAVGVTIDTSAAKFLDSKKLVHRDLAARVAAADLDGDGQAEAVVSGNDGTGPFVDILKLGYTASPGGGMPVVNVVGETPLDLSEIQKLEPADEWSTMVFDPSITGSVFTDPNASTLLAADSTSGYAGTLYLTTDAVPEPAMSGLLASGALFVSLRRRPACPDAAIPL